MDDYDILFENGNTIRAIQRNETAVDTYEFHGWEASEAVANALDTNAAEYYTLTVDEGRTVGSWGDYAVPDRVNMFHDGAYTLNFNMNGFVLNVDNYGRITLTPEEAAQYSELVKEADDQPDLEDEKGGALDDFLEEFSERKNQE